jgi:hypothetical protein
MSIRLGITFILLWILSAVAAGVMLSAQTSRASARTQASPPGQKGSVPGVLAGDEIGCRIERWQGDVPVGTLVIKVKGEWVDAQFAMKAQLVR